MIQNGRCTVGLYIADSLMFLGGLGESGFRIDAA